MLILAIFLIGPLVLIPKLLGASWLLAFTIGICTPMAILLGFLIVGAALDALDRHKRKKRRELAMRRGH